MLRAHLSPIGLLLAVLLLGSGCTDLFSSGDSAAEATRTDTVTVAVIDTVVAGADGVDSSAPVPSDTAGGGQAASPDTAAAEHPDAAAETDRPLDRETLEDVRSFGFRLAVAILVFLLAFFTIKGVVFVLETLAERSAERRLLYKRVIPIARIMLWSLALVVVLQGVFNVSARNLLAAATAIGVAVGFAAQDILKNIFGGLVIIFDQPFQAGDKISVGGTYGEVVSIGLRSTRIVTPDDNLVTVPNAQIVDGQVSNANAGALDCQVVTDLYLPGWVDESQAKRIAYEAAASSSYTYLKKPIAVIVKDEYDDGHVLHLKVKAYVLDTRFEFLLASDVTERARRVFRREGLLTPATRAFIDVASGPEAARSGDGAPDRSPD